MPFRSPSSVTFITQELPDLDGGEPRSTFDDVDAGYHNTIWWDATYDGGGVV